MSFRKGRHIILKKCVTAMNFFNNNRRCTNDCHNNKPADSCCTICPPGEKGPIGELGPAGNTSALGITPLAGGTRSVSAHLTIIQIQ